MDCSHSHSIFFLFVSILLSFSLLCFFLACILGFSCLGLLVPLFGTTAWICSMVSAFWCESVVFESSALQSEYGDFAFGPWTMQETQLVQTGSGEGTTFFIRETCVSHDLEADSKLKTVRAFTVIVAIVGGLLNVWILMNNCLYFMKPSKWNFVIGMYVIMTLFQGLTFLLLDSEVCTSNPLEEYLRENDANKTDEEWQNFIDAVYPTSSCQWAGGMTCNVIATVFWFVTALTMIFLRGPPQPPPVPPTETQQVTYTQTVNPDGTTTVAETDVIKGTAIPPKQQQEEEGQEVQNE